MVTMSQIAEAAGLSVATVSLALSGKGDRLSDSTRERIAAIAAELGYRPHASARATRSGRLNTLGLLMASHRDSSFLARRFLDGLSTACRDADLHLDICHLPESFNEHRDDLPRLLSEVSVDGVLINYHVAIPASLEKIIERERLPKVWINADGKRDAIRPDDVGLAATATRHLLELGHRRIAYADFVSPETKPFERHFSRAERERGYRETMRAAGLSPRFLRNLERLEFGDWAARTASALCGGDAPTAVVTYRAQEGLELRTRCFAYGLRVPEDVSIISIADEDLFDRWYMVDSVVVPWFEIGRSAIERLRWMVEGNPERTPDPRMPRRISTAGTTAPPR